MTPLTPNATPADDPNPLLDPDQEPQTAAEARAADDISDLVTEMHATVDKLTRDRASRADAKLLRTALAEMRYSFKVLAQYRHARKVSVFGSARTRPEAPAYRQAVEFGRQASAAGFMVITGAASGIMEAGHRGAERDKSIGLNIILPFEQGANAVIQGDSKLIHFKYFFTRKLLFVKESDAIVLFPGGFGTQDEGFEVFTLMQTGKSHLVPVVLIDPPGEDYWTRWLELVEGRMLSDGLISPADRAFYKVTQSVEEAVAECARFYRVYHSMRYVKRDLVLRLQRPVGEATLDRIRADFQDISAGGDFRVGPPAAVEANETKIAHLPRLSFRFDRRSFGRLRMLINCLNADPEP